MPKTSNSSELRNKAEILRKNLLAQTAYSPAARRRIEALPIHIVKDAPYGGMYDPDSQAIYIDEKLLSEESPELAIRILRHEFNHAFDGNVNNASMTTGADSRGFIPKYEQTSTVPQQRNLGAFFGQEFKRGMPPPTPKRLDAEGFAETGAGGQNTLLNAPEGVKESYKGVFEPYTPAVNYSPVYPAQRDKPLVKELKRKFTKQFAPAKEGKGESFKNAVAKNPVLDDVNQAIKTTRNVLPPVAPAEWKSFVESAKKVAQESGFPLSVILGQAALETGRTAMPGNNFFGIKGSGSAGTQDLATQEADGGGNFYSTRSNFAAYKSPEDSIRSYIDLIKNNYPQAYAQRKNPVAMVQAIKAGGYATDPNYVAKVTSTPEFQMYQRAPMPPSRPPAPQGGLLSRAAPAMAAINKQFAPPKPPPVQLTKNLPPVAPKAAPKKAMPKPVQKSRGGLAQSVMGGVKKIFGF